MKPLFLFFILSCISVIPFYSVANTEVDKDEILVTTEDVKIDDTLLVSKLAKTLKTNGLLTSSRQGTDSYMMAILCEFPKKGEERHNNFKPYCLLRRVKIKKF